MLNSLMTSLGLWILVSLPLSAAEINVRPPADSIQQSPDSASTFACRFGDTDSDSGDTRLGLTSTETRSVCPGEGFLFVDGVYVPPTQCTTWVNGVLKLQSAPSDRSSPAQQLAESRFAVDALLCWLPSPSYSRAVAMPERDLNRVVETLNSGGIAIVSPDQDIWCLPISSGGYELLSGLSNPPGETRNQLLESAEAEAPFRLDDQTRTWLTSYVPPASFIDQATARLSSIQAVEQQNIAAISAFHRFETWNYPMTVIGMVTVVVAVGSLISVRPIEIVGDASSPDDVTVRRFLWLIAGMSVIDLVWTLLAHQANRVAEVNPLGSIIVDDVLRVIIFKVLATSLAIGILFRLRHALIARKACWWACLTLALLTARWVVVSGVTG